MFDDIFNQLQKLEEQIQQLEQEGNLTQAIGLANNKLNLFKKHFGDNGQYYKDCEIQVKNLSYRINAANPFQERKPLVDFYEKFELDLALEKKKLRVILLKSPAGEAEEITQMPSMSLIKATQKFLSRHFETIDDNAIDINYSSHHNLRTIGEKLAMALLPGNVYNQYQKSLNMVRQKGGGLRILLRIRDRSIAIIPWEMAYIDNDFLSLRPSTPIIRYVVTSEPPARLSVLGTLRILGIISNPIDMNKLNVEKEKILLEEALEPLIQDKTVYLEWLDKADTKSLQTALHRHFHVIHYIGHGSYNESKKESNLWFQNEEGNRVAVKAENLAMLLRDSTVRLVFLNTCESGCSFYGLAQVLVEKGVPATLGMRTTILDTVAINFSAFFYRVLSYGWTIDSALVEGRKRIFNLLNSDLQLDWSLPILYTHAHNCELFDKTKGKSNNVQNSPVMGDVLGVFNKYNEF